MTRFAPYMAGLAAASLLLVACGSSEDKASTSTADANGIITVKLGVVGPQTGPAERYYRVMTQSFEAFGDEFVQKYKVRFDVVGKDDQASPELTTRAISELINEDGVDAVMGPPLSGNALQVAEIVQRSKVPWLLPGPTADQIIDYKQQPNWAFMTNYTSSQAVDVLGGVLYADNATVGIVYSGDGFGQSNLDQLTAWAAANGKPAPVAESIQPGTSDANASVKRMMDAGVTRLFLGITQGTDMATVTRAAQQARYAPERIFAPTTILSDFSTVATPEQWANIRVLDPRNYFEGGGKKVLDEVRTATGEEPALSTLNLSVYAMLDAYAQAVQQVGNAGDRERVRQALENVAVVHIGTDEVAKPFAADDHTLYDSNPGIWNMFAFNDKFEMVKLGSVAKCASPVC